MTMEMTAICRVVLVFFAVVLSFSVCITTATATEPQQLQGVDSGTTCANESSCTSPNNSESSVQATGADAGVDGEKNGKASEAGADLASPVADNSSVSRPADISDSLQEVTHGLSGGPSVRQEGVVAGVNSGGKTDSGAPSGVSLSSGDDDGTANVSTPGVTKDSDLVEENKGTNTGASSAAVKEGKVADGASPAVVPGVQERTDDVALTHSAENSFGTSGVGGKIDVAPSKSTSQDRATKDKSNGETSNHEEKSDSESANPTNTLAKTKEEASTTKGVQSPPGPTSNTNEGGTTHEEGITSTRPNTNVNDDTQNTQNNENDGGTTTTTTTTLPLETPSPGKDTTLSPSQDPQNLKDAGNVDSSDIPLRVSTPLVLLLLSLLYVAVCVER